MSLEIIDLEEEGQPAEDWVAEYKQKRTLFYDFTRELHDIIEKNLRTQGVEVFSIEARTKTVESFSEKISREGKSYDNPIQEITDLSACRVIFFYNQDVRTVEQVIRENFKIDEKNSSEKEKKGKRVWISVATSNY